VTVGLEFFSAFFVTRPISCVRFSCVYLYIFVVFMLSLVVSTSAARCDILCVEWDTKLLTQ